ncbi:hypothetical protein ACIQJT_15170 [Streptomyces sp. NPDC091972]|uniref:hypothetical protein n=1 Tax=Streptomyces sp. NPDC091972 TaxID=3366007 RepID=UPI00381B3F25
MTDRAFPSPNSDEVIGALERTGYLLEQRVASQVRSLGFSVTTGRAFEDPDEGKSREVDVYAIKRAWGDPSKDIQVLIQLVIECKRSTGPYVVLGRKPNGRDRSHQPHSHTMPISSVTWHDTQADHPRTIRVIPTWNWLGLHTLPSSPNLDSRKGVQLVRLNLQQNKWQTDNSSIFESTTVPLMKAVESFRPPRDTAEPPSYAVLNLCFPVLVTSGELFYVDGEEVAPIAEQVEWVSLERDIKMRSMTGLFNMDVVTYAALDLYLTNRVLAFSEAVAEEVARDPDRLKQGQLDAPPADL